MATGWRGSPCATAGRRCTIAASRRRRRIRSKPSARRARPRSVKASGGRATADESLFLADRNGDENAHLFVVDTDATPPAPRDLTPLDGARVEFVRTINNTQDVVLVRHNGRTGQLFDLYRLNITNGQLESGVENPGDVCGWSVTPLGGVRVRYRCLTDGGFAADLADSTGGWRQLFRADYGDEFRLLGFQSQPALRLGAVQPWPRAHRGGAARPS